MSYELHLVAPADGRVELADVRRYLALQPPVEVPVTWDANQPAWYRNPDTGVTFWIENDSGGSGPDGFKALVSCYLNYARPTFFAFEAMPFIAALARELGLLAVGGQTGTVPVLVDEAELIESWRSLNRQAIAAAAREGTVLPYMPQTRATAMWRYLCRMDELRARFGLDVFMPKLDAATEPPGDLVRHTTWTQAVPFVLPECELVSLVAEPRTRVFKLRGVVEYVVLRAALEPLLTELPGDPDGLCLLAPGRAAEAVPIFKALRPRRRALRLVATDSFVDWRAALHA